MVSALYFGGKSEGTSHFALLKYLPGLCEESDWVQEGKGRVVAQRCSGSPGQSDALGQGPGLGTGGKGVELRCAQRENRWC